MLLSSFLTKRSQEGKKRKGRMILLDSCEYEHRNIPKPFLLERRVREQRKKLATCCVETSSGSRGRQVYLVMTFVEAISHLYQPL